MYEIARILDAFRRELREPSLTYSVGLLLGGDDLTGVHASVGGTAQGKPNIIPRQASTGR